MNGRALHVYSAMKRIAEVIDGDPHLKARAAESRAYERFLEEIAAFETLATDERQAKINRPMSRNQLEQLAGLIMIELKCIDGADRLSGQYADVFSSVKKPSSETRVWQFTSAVHGYLDAMEQHRERLIGGGMHPNKFDDARKLLCQYEDLHQSWSGTDAHLQLAPKLIRLWVERAQQRGELLHNELYSAMSKEALTKWNVAASLGRTHRPRALSPGGQRALPAPQKAESTPTGILVEPARPESVPENAVVLSVLKSSLGKRTVRAVLRVFGGTDGDATAVLGTRQSREGIDQLPDKHDGLKSGTNAA